MIKVLRVTLANNVPYEAPTMFLASMGDSFPDGVPNIFEDAQVVLVCKDGRFVLPDF